MFNLKHKQSGVVLVIGLLMLLVITVVGVTAMSGTTNNERMTANYQFQSLSFQAAESAIKENYNFATLFPAVMAVGWLVDPGPTNYDVDIKNGTPIAVQADASVQFCGELPGPVLCSGMNDPSCRMEWNFDVRGEGNVSTLGTQEQHLRRGEINRPRIGNSFNTSLCTMVP